MSRSVETGTPTPAIFTFGSRCSYGAGLIRIGSAIPASGASPWSDAANCILAYPFHLEQSTKFNKGFWVNGGTGSGGNVEIGVWDDAYTKLFTTGSVAQSASTNVPQAAVFASSATPTLPPGLYYCGMACSATTTGLFFRWSVATFGAAVWQSFGCWRQSGVTLGSLAATATPGDMTNVAFPVFGLISRTVFDA